MSGGIVQLVTVGAQDACLTGKPEVSFFRSSYKRYTHYAASTERQIIQGKSTPGGISTVRFEKKGDLVNYVYLIAKDSTGALIPNIYWPTVVDKVELLIGGQIIDTQDMVYMSNIEPVTGAQNYSQRLLNNNTAGPTNNTNGFLPLKFFFCKDWNVSLPLVALQYHDVELRITWSPNITAAQLGYQYETWCNFVFLDQGERDYFAKTPMDILIPQVNRIPIGTGNMQELALAHPTKFIAFQSNNYSIVYTQTATDAVNYQFKQQINGVDVGDSRSLFQWADVTQYYHTPYGYNTGAQTANVAVIPFCLDTSKLQPTGTINFSRIDSYRLIAPAGMNFQKITNGSSLYFYSVNYNVLRIKDGMSGLLYSN